MHGSNHATKAAIFWVMLIAWDECHLTLFLFSICILLSEKTSDYLVKGRKKQIRIRISYLGYICAFVACYCGVGALLIFLFLWNRTLEIIDLDPICTVFFFFFDLKLSTEDVLQLFCLEHSFIPPFWVNVLSLVITYQFSSSFEGCWQGILLQDPFSFPFWSWLKIWIELCFINLG